MTGRSLFRARVAAGLTMRELGLKIGFSATKISDLERDRCEIDGHMEQRLRQALGILPRAAVHLMLFEDDGKPAGAACAADQPGVRWASFVASRSPCPDCMDLAEGLLRSMGLAVSHPTRRGKA